MGLPKLIKPETKVKHESEEAMLILLSSVTDQLQLRLLDLKLAKLRKQRIVDISKGAIVGSLKGLYGSFSRGE